MSRLNLIPEMILHLTSSRGWTGAEVATIITRSIPHTARSQVHSALANLCRRGEVLKDPGGLYRATATSQLPDGNGQA